MFAFLLGILVAGVAFWAWSRRRPTVSASSAPPGDPALLVARPSIDRDQVLAAAGRVGAARVIIRQAFSFLESQHGEEGHLDPEDMTSEVVGYLLAKHTALVLAGPAPLALGCFALARGIDACFLAEHERKQRDACALALMKVLKPPTKHVWPPLDKLLYQSAFDAALTWDRRPDQVVERLFP